MSTLNAIPEGRHDNTRKGNGSRPDGGFQRALLAGSIALVLLLPGAGFAADPTPADTPAKEAVTAVDNLLITTPPPPPNVRRPILSWGEGNGRAIGSRRRRSWASRRSSTCTAGSFTPTW